ncbi:hypothetical protein ES707_09433 [subsurface metagenome]
MKADIYCRVSTDNQESEGTSLQTQLEACLNYCQSKGYEVAYCFSEAYSGLTLDRPKLNELRELVRNEQIDVLVVYCLDRLSRDPTHGVILTQELEKHNVILEAVTETIDSSELGKLISYIRGFASKLEAEKIRERTMRGKRARAREGRIPGGGVAKLYGYNYIKVSQENGGRRVINETETEWVRKIYEWLVNDGLSTSAITYRLRDLGAPTKCGGLWCRSAVLNILKNPAYTGKTYAFTTVNGKPFTRAPEEWIEIPGVTPAIIPQELFEAAHKQLQVNRTKATRNVKHKYLLRGHIYCAQCGRAFYGCTTNDRVAGQHSLVRRYQCSGKLRMVVPVYRCKNKSWQGNKLEALVWEQIEHVLDNPEFIITEMEKQSQGANELGVLEIELQQIERRLKTLNREQKELLENALRGFPESLIISENKKINSKKTGLEAQKAELETQIKASQDATISLPKLEHFVELLRQKLTMLDFETKRLALDMLNIRVLLDGHNVEITGTIPIMDDVIVTTQP